MSKQSTTTIILFIVAAVLLAGLLGYNYWNQKQMEEHAASKDFFQSFSAEDVTSISLTEKEQEINLSLVDGTWVVESEDNAPADSTAIEELIRVIRMTTSNTIVARTLEKKDEYGLSDEKRIHVVVTATQGVVADYYVGKGGGSMTTYYAHLADQDVIHLVNGSRFAFAKADWKKEIEETTEEEVVE